MRLVTRVGRLEIEERAAALQAVAAAEAALIAAEAAQQAWFDERPKKNPYGRQTQEIKVGGPTSWNLRAMRDAFKPAHDAALDWLAAVGRLRGIVLAFDADPAGEGPAVVAAVEALSSLRQALESALPLLRATSSTIEPMKPAVAAMITAIQAVDRVLDVEVVPSLLSGDPETSDRPDERVADRYRTSDDVAKSLRRARPAVLEPQDPEPVVEKGLLGALKRFLGR
jgi:hypothetical protein